MERLSAQALAMLWPEELGWSQDIGALLVLDGTWLLDGDGRFQIEVAREQFQARLQLVPRFRRLLYRPRVRAGLAIVGRRAVGRLGRARPPHLSMQARQFHNLRTRVGAQR